MPVLKGLDSGTIDPNTSLSRLSIICLAFDLANAIVIPLKFKFDMKTYLPTIVLLLVVVAIAFGLRSKFERFGIPQNGMYPGLPAGSSRWVTKNSFETADEFSIGDIVLFTKESEQGTYNFVWRVIALPGDEVTIEKETIEINGAAIKREFLRSEGAFKIYAETHGGRNYEVAYNSDAPVKNQRGCAVTVPDGHLFLLGDNRYDAMDSRYHGPVPIKDVFGKISP